MRERDVLRVQWPCDGNRTQLPRSSERVQYTGGASFPAQKDIVDVHIPAGEMPEILEFPTAVSEIPQQHI